MLKLLSSIKNCERLDYTAADAVKTGSVTGSWVTIDGSDELVYASSPTKLAFPIWTESYRDGTAGSWTPDVDATGNLTILVGSMRGITDQVSGTYADIAIGDLLVVADDGTLKESTATVMSDGTEAGVLGDEAQAVAVVVKKHASVTYLGTTFTDCIEFKTI